MRQKKSLLAVLGTLSFACLFSAVAFMPKTATSAETDKINVENVLMEEGATVRVSGEGALTEKTGLRFNMYIDKAIYDANTVDGVAPEVGMYVALTEDLTGDQNLTSLAGIQAIKDAKNFLGLAYMQEGILSSDDTVSEVLEFRVVNELPVSLYGKAITANGYIKIGDDYIFSTNPQSRSIAQISDIALDSGAENDDLTAFVDGALTAENFGFAVGAEYVTDGYKNFDLGATIPNDLTADWASDDESVVTVEDGVLTRVGEGEATITAKIGSTVRETTITVKAPNELIVDSATWGNVYNYDGWTKFGSYVDASTLGFEGGYTGKATAIKQINAGNYWLMQSYTVEELTVIAKDYNTVTLWFAVDNIASGSIHLFEGHNAFSNKAFPSENPNAPGRHTVTAADNGIWKKWTISMSDYIALTRETATLREGLGVPEHERVKLFHAWGEYSAVEGKTITYYFGNIEFSLNPVLFKANSSNSHYFRIDQWTYSSYVEDVSTLGFAGDYTGSAAKLQRVTSGGFKLLNDYTMEELKLYKKVYDTVSIWFAMDALTAGSVRFYTVGDNYTPENFINKAGLTNKIFVAEPTTSDHLPSATWMKISISIDDYISLLTAEDGTAKEYCSLFGSWSWESAGGEHFYLGNVEFGVNNDAVRITDSTSAYNYYLDQWNACTFVSAANLKADGFTGDYNGNATKIKMYATTYSFKNFFTAETIKDKAKKFNTVSVWLTSDGIEDETGYVCMMGGVENTFMYHWLNGRNHALNAASNGVWVKYSISMDNFIKLLEANNYAEYCPLVNTWGERFGGYFYFGDMFFENV